MADPPIRLLNFISEQQLAENREKGGERDDVKTTAALEKPLYEILKENKDKQQSEFNERLKHRPPKALDEDETEFLEQMETYKREQERQISNEEAQQLLNFQAAVASTMIKSENLFQQPKEVKAFPKEKRPAPSKPLTSLVRIKPQPKKAKVDEKTAIGSQETNHEGVLKEQGGKVIAGQAKGLVSYGMDSDEEDG